MSEIPPNGHCDSALRAFRCDDGRCLPRDQVCDISQDCPGGEDEDQDCGEDFFFGKSLVVVIVNVVFQFLLTHTHRASAGGIAM